MPTAFCPRRWLAALALGTALAAPAAAQAPSTNATVNLIRLLIKQQVITQAAGDALLAQAEAEAEQARAAIIAAAPRAPVESAALPPPAEGSIRVPYIPQTVRDSIKEDIRKEVLAQADYEGWARPNQLPGWLKGVTLTGDFRFRSESVFYSDANSADIVDTQAFNAASPIDINAGTNPLSLPFLNTTVDRTNRLRIRARLGVIANISPEVQFGARLATGDDNSPISTNQTLGGGLAKKDIWLDQGYLRLTPVSWGSLTVGRFANPFQYSEILYDNDLNFDGAVAKLDAAPVLGGSGLTGGLTLGAFPLEFTSNNTPNNSPFKTEDDSKWLFSAQAAAGYKIAETYDIGGAVAYHSFKGVQGILSEPCALRGGNRSCSTDGRRPTFLRKGNTLFYLRDIQPDPASPTNFAQAQLLGLSYDYDVLDLIATAKVPLTERIGVELQGNYLKNLGFKRGDLCRFAQSVNQPLTNIVAADPIGGATPGTPGAAFYTDPCVPEAGTGRIARYVGGDEGWSVKALIGVGKPRAWGDWNVEIGYRYLQSDAVLDAYADSDFHLGGTNTKGYTIGASLGLYKNVVLSGKWLSANEISGEPLAIDVLQIDLTAAF